MEEAVMVEGMDDWSHKLQSTYLHSASITHDLSHTRGNARHGTQYKKEDFMNHCLVKSVDDQSLAETDTSLIATVGRLETLTVSWYRNVTVV